MYPIINILGKEIGSYALIALVGFFVCGAVIYFSCKKQKFQFEDIVMTILVTVGGLFIGAHLLYGIVNLPILISQLSLIENLTIGKFFSLLLTTFGGMVFYGGFLGGLFGLLIYKKFKKTSLPVNVIDVYAFSIPLFQAFGRVGCFFGGCCYGIESEFGFIAENNPIVPEMCGVRRLPISLIEAGFNILIFAVLFYFFKKGKFKNRLLVIYMILYPTVRFCTEFFRGDEVRGIFFGLSTSQWISIILIIFSLCIILKSSLIKNKKKRVLN